LCLPGATDRARNFLGYRQRRPADFSAGGGIANN
jgi:hypothetical protein